MFKIERWMYLALAVGVLVTAAWLGYNHAISAAEERGANKAITDRATDDNKLLLAAYAHNKELKDQLTKERQAGIDERSKLEHNHEEKLIAVESRVRSGAERLRCPAATPIHTDAAPGSTAVVSGPPTTQGADLVPDASIAFIRIAGASARDVRDYNAVVKEHNQMREMCNAK